MNGLNKSSKLFLGALFQRSDILFMNKKQLLKKKLYQKHFLINYMIQFLMGLIENI